MSNWQKINYLGDKFKPFHVRLDYCHEDVALQDIYRFDDDEAWINKTVKEIQDGYKYWVILRARVYLAGVEVGSHSLGGLLFDNTEQMESMMRSDYEGIIAEAVDNAKHNLKQMADAMNEMATA
jgi:hypothetical protein